MGGKKKGGKKKEGKAKGGEGTMTAEETAAMIDNIHNNPIEEYPIE